MEQKEVFTKFIILKNQKIMVHKGTAGDNYVGNELWKFSKYEIQKSDVIEVVLGVYNSDIIDFLHNKYPHYFI